MVRIDMADGHAMIAAMKITKKAMRSGSPISDEEVMRGIFPVMQLRAEKQCRSRWNSA